MPSDPDRQDAVPRQPQQEGPDGRVDQQEDHGGVVIPVLVPQPPEGDVRHVEGVSQDLHDGEGHSQLLGRYRVGDHGEGDLFGVDWNFLVAIVVVVVMIFHTDGFGIMVRVKRID